MNVFDHLASANRVLENANMIISHFATAENADANGEQQAHIGWGLCQCWLARAIREGQERLTVAEAITATKIGFMAWQLPEPEISQIIAYTRNRDIPFEKREEELAKVYDTVIRRGIKLARS